MEKLLDNILLWTLMAIIVFLVLQVFLIRVENEYLKDFDKPLVHLKERIWSTLVCAVGMLIICWIGRNALPAVTFLPIALASASLVGIWRVDRELFLIPDRFQLLGFLAALGFVGSRILTGEDARELAIETGFALALVGLLWVMSVIYFRIRGVVGFGFGDIKLLAWLSFFVGKRMPNLVLMSVFFGFMFLLVRVIENSRAAGALTLPKAKDALAFGPAIVLAFFFEAWWFYG